MKIWQKFLKNHKACLYMGIQKWWPKKPPKTPSDLVFKKFWGLWFVLCIWTYVKRINHYLTTTIDHARPRFYTDARLVNKVNGAKLGSMFAEISSAIRPHFSHCFGFSLLTFLFALRFARKFTHLICFCWIWRTFVLIRILSQIFFF